MICERLKNNRISLQEHKLECYVMNDDEMKNWRIERMVELMICFEDYRGKYDK